MYSGVATVMPLELTERRWSTAASSRSAGTITLTANQRPGQPSFGTTGATVELLLPHLFIKNLSVLGSTMGPRSAFPEIFRNIAAGTWRPVVDRVMPLSGIREAHELLESRDVVGKIVLVPGK